MASGKPARKHPPTSGKGKGKGKGMITRVMTGILDVTTEQFMSPMHEAMYRTIHVPSFKQVDGKLPLYITLEAAQSPATDHEQRYFARLTFYTNTAAHEMYFVRQKLGYALSVGHFSDEDTAHEAMDYVVERVTQLLRIHYTVHAPQRFEGGPEEYVGKEFDASEIDAPYDDSHRAEEEFVRVVELQKRAVAISDILIRADAGASVPLVERKRPPPAALDDGGTLQTSYKRACTDMSNARGAGAGAGGGGGCKSSPSSSPVKARIQAHKLPPEELNQWSHEGVFPSPYLPGAFSIVLPASIIPPTVVNGRSDEYLPIIECASEKRARMLYAALIGVSARPVDASVKRQYTPADEESQCDACCFGDATHACLCGSRYHVLCVPTKFDDVIAACPVRSESWRCPNCRLIDVFHATEWAETTVTMASHMSSAQLLHFLKAEGTMANLRGTTVSLAAGVRVAYYNPETGATTTTTVTSTVITENPPWQLENGEGASVAVAGRWCGETRRFLGNAAIGFPAGEGANVHMVPISRVRFKST